MGDVVDDLHGRRVPDPYRWLEDPDAPEVRAWLTAQQRVTSGWLDANTVRAPIRERLTELWDHARRGTPWRRGHRWFQMRNSGLQSQQVLWTMDAADAEGRVLLDPNAWTDDGTAALTGLSISRDGRWMAYARSDRGSDWMIWRVRDLDAVDGDGLGAAPGDGGGSDRVDYDASDHDAIDGDLDDVVEWSKFSTAAWAPDGSGFYYCAYDPPESGREYHETNTDQRLCFHRLGDDQADDVVVYARPDQPEWGFDPWVSHDGRWLVVTVTHGTDPRTRLYLGDLHASDDPATVEIRPLLDAFDAEYQCIGSVGSTLYILTDNAAPSRRVIAVDVDDAAPSAWREIIPAGDDTTEYAELIGGRIVTVRLHHASHRVALHDLDGAGGGDLDLRGYGSVSGISGLPDDPIAHVGWTTFTEPTRITALDVRDGASAHVFAPALPERASDVELVTKQVFVESSDGAQVPMFVIHRADVDPSAGPAPTILYGYGGFGISITPAFSVVRSVWVERGGVMAIANLRGGGEYGTAWHDAGRLQHKQQVFDDAIACAQWLGDQGWTSPAHLAIEGGSNGGLLVGACITQRPELFGGAVAHVGVFDMLRFHLFTIGWAWRSDYGDPDDLDGFATLHAYSPLHNVRTGTAYPATLIVTGDHDDRVVPGHSFKFAAAMQAAQAGPAPVLLRVETSAGHGAGKPTSKLIDEATDVLAFCETVLRDRHYPSEIVS